MRITNTELEYLSRIEYHFDKNDKETKEIFNTITEVLYKEFLDNPSFINVRMNLEGIINDDVGNLKKESQIKLSILKNRYGIDKGFNGQEHYMYDIRKPINVNNNKIAESIRRVVMAPLSERYYKVIMYYLTYLYIKCKQNVVFDYVNEKLQNDLEQEVESIAKFNDIFSSFNTLEEYASKLDGKANVVIFNYYNFGYNSLSYANNRYKKYIDNLTDAVITDDFTDKGKIKYVDNSNSVIKFGLPSTEIILNKKNNSPNIIK